MSYGHAEKIARSAAAVPPAPPVDPRLFDSPEMRATLGERDIGALFRAVKATGVSYRTIAALVGMSQSEVSEIIGGRQVLSYDLLVRIAQCLGVPRELMGLSYGAYAGDKAPQSGEVREVTEDMQRRDAIAVGALATLGFVPSFAALLDSSAAPGEVPLPSRLGASDVAEIRNTTESLRASARLSGGQARTASAAAAHCRRLTAVPAAEQVTRSLGSALAELDELAGWCCHDAGLDRHARWHYRTAADLARRVGDDYRVASALRFAGLVDARRDNPNDAIKLYQLAGVKLGNRNADLAGWLRAVSAHGLAVMGHEQAADHLSRAQEAWQSTEDGWRADQNYQIALVHHKLGHIETAERFAGAVNSAGRHRPVGTFAGILRATIYVQTGESRGLGMAKAAIESVAPMHSIRARERLAPLGDALESRRGNDYRELAQMARKVSVTRAA